MDRAKKIFHSSAAQAMGAVVYRSPCSKIAAQIDRALGTTKPTHSAALRAFLSETVIFHIRRIFPNSGMVLENRIIFFFIQVFQGLRRETAPIYNIIKILRRQVKRLKIKNNA
jgi:hypothetical protein